MPENNDGFQGELFATDAIEEPSPTTSSPPARDRRIFADWDRTLIDCAVAFLARDWNGGVLDLSSLLVIVPTRHSGRRLREALAVHTAEKGAVIPPLVVTPEFLVSPERLPDPAAGASVAGDAEALLAWIETLRSVDTARLRSLFPVDPVERTFSWALHTASHLMNLRKSLAEAALTVRDAARGLADGDMEPRRWRDLASLEESALKKLDAWGLLDPESSRIRAAHEGALPDSVARMLILGVADPLPLALTALERHAAAIPTEILVYAPEDLRDLFDLWGRPLTEAWKARPIDIPHADTAIHDAATPAAQADKVLQLLQPYKNEDAANAAAVSVPDAALGAPLRKALGRRGLGAFEPAGDSLQTHEIFFLLDTLSDLLKTRSMNAFAELIRCPDFADALQALATDEGARGHAQVLKCFDDLQAGHLPDTVDDAALMLERFPPRNGENGPSLVLRTVLEWLRRLDSEPFGTVLPDFLAFAYGCRSFRADRPDDGVFAAASEAVSRHLDAMESASLQALANAERIELLLYLLQSEKFYSERAPVDVDLQGWLELFWEDAPHLIITGFNDGQVPETVVGDPYLPNKALAQLGLRNNDHWLARDAYYLTAILASRAALHGKTDIIFGRIGGDGSPLRPSRLLFHCPDDELPARALQLFHGAGENGNAEDPSETPAARTRTWKLKPPPLPEVNGLSKGLRVTAFKSFLACPFRFYMSTGLDTSEVELGKMEMNPMEFGNLCHEVLKRFGRNESLRNSDDATEIRRFLLDEAEKYVSHHYGDKRTVPVMIQLDAARQRLAAAADTQVELRRGGWKIQEAEWKLHGLTTESEAATEAEAETAPWLVHGMPVRGVIDRIDRHEESGALRVIDYKTSAKPVTPADAHLHTFGRNENPDDRPAWSKTEDTAGNPAAWIDLQLPLYVHAVRDRLAGAAGARIECAYFNLPRAVTETGLRPWDELDDALLAAAMTCAGGVIDAVRHRQFWPPSESVSFDDFESLFFGDAVESIDEDHFRQILNTAPAAP